MCAHVSMLNVCFVCLFVCYSSLVSVSLCAYVRVDPQYRWAIGSSSIVVVPVPVLLLSCHISASLINGYFASIFTLLFPALLFLPPSSIPPHFCLFTHHPHTHGFFLLPSPLHHHSETRTPLSVVRKKVVHLSIPDPR